MLQDFIDLMTDYHVIARPWTAARSPAPAIPRKDIDYVRQVDMEGFKMLTKLLMSPTLR